MRVLDEHIYADQAISGTTDDRAGLQGLLAAAKQKPRPFDVVLVDDTSRLSRRLEDALRIREKLQFAGVRIVYVAQGFDSESKQAELLTVMHGIVDSQYIGGLREKTRRGMEQAIIEGLHAGGRVFGYRRRGPESIVAGHD